MSPLLTARPSVSVTLRLVGACVVTALAAATVAFTGHDGRSSAAAPACLAGGCVCAALVAHMLNASWKANDDARLAWMCAGVTVALIGLVTTLFTSPAIFPDGSSIFSQSGDAAVTRYLIIHLALVVAGALAIAGVSPRPRSLLIFGGLGFLLLAWAAVDSSPVGGVPTPDGIGLGARGAVGLLALAQVAVAILWWRRSSGAPTRGGSRAPPARPGGWSPACSPAWGGACWTCWRTWRRRSSSPACGGRASRCAP